MRRGLEMRHGLEVSVLKPTAFQSRARQRAAPGSSRIVSTIVFFVAAAALMAAAIFFVYRTGATLYYGDAEAHLDIARRIVDSRTPGWSQVGTTWLPLPHLLMIPLVRNDWLWQTGLAGAITSGACMTIAATFLFAAIRRLFVSASAAIAGVAVFLLNPNTLYLGSIPMTESVFLRRALRTALLHGAVPRNAGLGRSARRVRCSARRHVDALRGLVSAAVRRDIHLGQRARKGAGPPR